MFFNSTRTACHCTAVEIYTMAIQYDLFITCSWKRDFILQVVFIHTCGRCIFLTKRKLGHFTYWYDCITVVTSDNDSTRPQWFWFVLLWWGFYTFFGMHKLSERQLTSFYFPESTLYDLWVHVHFQQSADWWIYIFGWFFAIGPQ